MSRYSVPSRRNDSSAWATTALRPAPPPFGSPEQVAEELRAEHDPVPQPRPRGQELPDDLLGVSVGVDVGGVERIAATFQVLGDHSLGLGDRSPPAVVFTEGHGAQSVRTDPQAGAAKRDETVEWHAPESTP